MSTFYKPGSWNVHCSSCKQEKLSDDFYIHSNGKLVSGLHAPDNLQYLLAIDNIKKSNKYA